MPTYRVKNLKQVNGNNYEGEAVLAKVNNLRIDCPVCKKKVIYSFKAGELGKGCKVEAECCFCNFVYIIEITNNMKKKKKKPKDTLEKQGIILGEELK